MVGAGRWFADVLHAGLAGFELRGFLCRQLAARFRRLNPRGRRPGSRVRWKRGWAECGVHVRTKARESRATHFLREVPLEAWNDRAGSFGCRADLYRIGAGIAHQLAAI